MQRWRDKYITELAFKQLLHCVVVAVMVDSDND